MHSLRERLASDFEQILKEGEPLLVNGEPLVIDGKVVMKRPAPAMYNVIRQFLRDNGIDREPLDQPPGGKPAIVSALPFHEDPSEIEELPAHLQIDRSE
jgi:hypothetical protein